MTQVARLESGSGKWLIHGEPHPRHPREAPRFECCFCGKPTVEETAGIGPVILLDDHRVICHRCRSLTQAHAKLFPDCPEDWHDPLEHAETHGSSAAIATILGIWNAHRGYL